GRTKHIPADGRPLSAADARVARTKHADLASQVAAYHKLRQAAQGRTQIASAERGPSKATPEPRPQQRIALASPPPEPLRSPTRAEEGQPVPKLVAAPQLVRRPA